MIDLENQTKLTLDLNSLALIADTLSQKDIELILTDSISIAHINQTHRGKAQATDVLSFPIESPFNDEQITMPLGTIIICDSFVIDNAKRYGHSTQDELSLLFIHGLLHLLGFDHEKDHGEMRQKEKELIRTFSLPKSLIIRTQE